MDGDVGGVGGDVGGHFVDDGKNGVANALLVFFELLSWCRCW